MFMHASTRAHTCVSASIRPRDAQDDAEIQEQKLVRDAAHAGDEAGLDERKQQQQQEEEEEYEEEGRADCEGDANFGGFPLVFFGVEGRDVSDDDSPSFYNPTEAMVVRSLISKLLDMKHLGVTTDQIGVIAPYRKQVPRRVTASALPWCMLSCAKRDTYIHLHTNACTCMRLGVVAASYLFTPDNLLKIVC